MNQKINNIINELKTLTLIEASELVKELENIFGIDVSTPTISNQVLIKEEISTQTEKQEEKTTFDVILNEVPTDKRISILKIVRNITGLGLKESKEIVDNVPKVLKEGVSKEEGESIKKDLETAGATNVILK